jgi:hypothetical protein
MARDRELRVGLVRVGESAPAWQTQGPALKKFEPLLLSSVFAVSLHFALLSVPVRNEPARQLSTWTGRAQPVLVRMLSTAGDQLTDRKLALAIQGDQATVQRPNSDKATHEVEAIATPQFHPTADAQRSPSPEIRGLALRMPGVLGDDEFFARNALDIGPYPTQPVLIDYP